VRKNEKYLAEIEEMAAAFLPTEEVDPLTSALNEIRTRVGKLEQQMMSQYTAMAAYATIAQQHTDNVRAEGRADLDRSQATVIGLVEKLRMEMLARFEGAETRGGGLQALGVDASARLAALEDKLATMSSALEIYARENASLKSQLAAMTEQRLTADGWLLGDPRAGELTLR
jgi:chromosome segregation ATPase